MEKDLRYATLFDIYQGLLTDKQREVFTSYYLLDLSLSEIADNDGASRQSAYDTVKKVKQKLDEFEDKLQILSKRQAILDIISDKNDQTFDKIKGILLE